MYDGGLTLHCAGQTLTSQAIPVQLVWQKHRPPTHIPFPVQLRGHTLHQTYRIRNVSLGIIHARFDAPGLTTGSNETLFALASVVNAVTISRAAELAHKQGTSLSGVSGLDRMRDCASKWCVRIDRCHDSSCEPKHSQKDDKPHKCICR